MVRFGFAILFTVLAGAQDTTDFRLVWSDEFNADAASPPDIAKWNYDIGNGAPANPGWGNNEWETYTSSTANVFHDGNGSLIIRALRTAGGPEGYTSGRIKTLNKFSFKYGIVTARIKIPYAQGVWPAFWMLGANFPGTPWPYCGEIDIMENFGVQGGDSSRYRAAMHGPGYSGVSAITGAYTLPNSQQISDSFHVFSVQWSPGSVEFFVDGQSYRKVTKANLPSEAPWVFDNTFFILLNVAVAGSPVPVGSPEGTPFPQEMAIDYVRVYEPPNRFVTLAPCRIADTRDPVGPFGGPSVPGGSSRDFAVADSSCGVPPTATAYSLNVTVIPKRPLGYLTVWPAGQTKPFVSTLNSDGRIKANATIAPAGTDGKVSVFVTDDSDVVLDINGYFGPSGTLMFQAIDPCRVGDTRNPVGEFGGPVLSAQSTRSLVIPRGQCGIPATAQAYSLNFTVVPRCPLGYLTTWPAGHQRPFVSTLNSPTGNVVANAAIVPAGIDGAINTYVTHETDLVVDITGYFAPAGQGGLSFYWVPPCRWIDTRNSVSPFGGPSIAGGQTRMFGSAVGQCSISSEPQAYALNATVVPLSTLGYLTLWPSAGLRPLVSTLNATDGTVVANAAIVSAKVGAISADATDETHLIIDVNGYFGP